MSHKKRSLHNKPQASAAPRQTAAEDPSPQTKSTVWLKRVPWTYIVTFLLFFVFTYFVYGDVFRRAAEENFISTNETQMRFLTLQSWGWLYCIGRWMLLVFKSKLLGAILYSLVLTVVTALTDYICHLPCSLRGLGSIIPTAILFWVLYRGTNLYYKFEPSLFILYVVIALLVLACLALVLRLTVYRKAVTRAGHRFPFGLLAPVVFFTALTVTARLWNENEILTARVQLLSQQTEWDSIIDEALSAHRPSRAVVAYYAIALEQTGQLLERQYDIAFDFPKVRLQEKDHAEEYGLFVPDCNLYAGLVNAAYHAQMNFVTMNGPNVYSLKRMTQCAVLNGEKELALKYLDILSHVPFEQSFVDEYTAMVNDSSLVEQKEELNHILELAPQANNYENNYRTPAFLGYNAGLLTGTNYSLVTAIAAGLYSKDLLSCLPHIRIYVQNSGGNVPVIVQQAMLLAANKYPELKQEFAPYIKLQQPTFNNFIIAAQPLIQERLKLSKGKSEQEQERLKHEYNAKLRDALGKDWVGTYFYYYYCENNDQNQVKQKAQGAVN